MQKILVLRGGALGDFIVTLPLLQRLRRRWPEAKIELIGNQSAADLAVRAGLLTRAHSQHESRWLPLFLNEKLPEGLRAWFSRFDLVLNFWPDPDALLRKKFPMQSRQLFRSGPAQPQRSPAAAHFSGILDEFHAPSVENFCFLGEPSAGAVNIAFHYGSGSPQKNWPMDRWRHIAKFLRERYNRSPLVISGPAEWTRDLAAWGEPLDSLPLPELLARLQTCRYFLGHDSGISHLAAACGVPSLLLFGPTSPAMWAPPAPHVSILRRGSSLDLISVEEVQTEISHALPEL